MYSRKGYQSIDEKLGLPFFGVTPQNEPEFPAPWEACSHTPITESDFVGYHLGPQLKKDHPHIKILGFDHNKDHIVKWVDGLIADESPSTPYVSGTAYHWYAGGNNRILDGALGAPNMHRLQAELDELHADPKHFLINIESCHCPYTGYGGGAIDVYWARAERYAHTILSDLAAGSNGWVSTVQHYEMIKSLRVFVQRSSVRLTNRFPNYASKKMEWNFM